MTKVVIVSPSAVAYSETFILAHIERLPAEVEHLYGGTPPTLVNGAPIAPPFTLRRHVAWTIERLATKITWEQWNQRPLIAVLQDADLVLAEYGTTGVAVMDACTAAGVPLIVYFRGYDAFHKEILEGPGKRYPELFQKAAAIIAVSRGIEHQILTLGANPVRVHYIPSGIDTAMFHPGDPAQAPVVFLTVGRFVDKKAPDLTLMAFAKVVRQVPEARLVMAGDGPLLGACQRLTAALDLKESVDITGVQSHKAVAQLMQGARAFVQHSITAPSGDSEGTPNSIKEAQASGLPVVSTRHGGIPEIAVDGETGLLVDEGDVDGMAEAMIRLAQEPQLAARMGQAGRKRIEEHFSMEQSIGSLWQVTKAAIEGKANATR